MFEPILTLLLACMPGCGATGAPTDGAVHGRSERRINLDLKDAEIHNVLRLFAEVGKINLVVGDEVSGRVTIHLRAVPWKEALAVVLEAKGLGQEQSGNVIRVDTLERLAARQAQRAELAKAKEESADLVTVMLPLSYARAAELKPIVEGLLTPRGTVVVEPRTNTLLVTDVAQNVDRVRSTLGRH